ncbi:hypothetical protein NDU88_000886 [Pleurodeles waltl]|uniref:Uncharacterized protein n=1 Tax=Pleurodeles waltl TaxID=8319 RepID=A0AAV7S9Z2_PLEWA|nr:hypothetical protein NDU88_000886 [Pleurodeles waltl]
MSERLDKYTEHLDMDEQVTVVAAQKCLDKLMLTLQSKTENLEARLRHKNLCIVWLAETTYTANMKSFVEALLINLLGCKMFADVCVVERAHHWLLGVQQFWQAVRVELEEMVNVSLEFAPELALLGYDRDVPSTVRRLVALVLLFVQNSNEMGARTIPGATGLACSYDLP